MSRKRIPSRRRGRSTVAVGASIVLVLLLLGAALWAAAPGTQLARWTSAERVRSLPAAEKEELLSRQRRFEALPLAEQQRLRELHEAVHTAADSERLVQVMDRYHNWLKSLQPSKRAELMSLSETQRVAAIEQLIQQQAADRFREYAASQLEPSDLAVIEQWLSEIVGQRPEAFAKLLAPEHRRGFEHWERPRQLLMLRMAILGYQRRPAFEIPPDEIQSLANKLSPKAQQALATVSGSEPQADMIREWVRAAAHAQARKFWEVSNEELLKFRREQLSEEEREWLANLHPDEMRRELTRRYFAWRARSEGRPGPRGPRSGRSGPRRPDWSP